MSLANVKTSQKQRRINRDFKKVLEKYKNDLSAMEMLAVAAHLVGTLIALQDKNKVTAEQAIELVQLNIQAGNDAALQSLETPAGAP